MTATDQLQTRRSASAAARASALARETLRQLVRHGLPPTPQNYADVYARIAGIDAATALDGAKGVLESLGRELAADATGLRTDAAALEHALGEGDLDKVRELLAKSLRRGALYAALDWPALIRELLRTWEARVEGWTAARKRESLEHVLQASALDPQSLHKRLRALVRAWAEAPQDAAPETGAVVCDHTPHAPAPAGLHDLLAAVIEQSVPAEALDPRLPEKTRELAQAIRDGSAGADLDEVAARVRTLFGQIDREQRRYRRLLDGMVRLMRVLIENIGGLAGDDRWLTGQLKTLRALMEQPLDPHVLNDAERLLRDVVLRQGPLRQGLDDAQGAMREMIAAFINRLGTLSDATDRYQEQIDGHARRIESAASPEELPGIVAALAADTRGMQADIVRSREALAEARQRAAASEARIRALENELAMVSELACEDHLTGALNRRGLDRAFDTETARAARSGEPLCVALLDLDRFKQLNDRHGHQAGDRALAHLVGVVRDALRPTDVVARYGGEEFAILLPATELAAATQVLVRLQRELTRRFFLHDLERILITFSAGVTTFRPGETCEAALARADQGVYEAKRTGRNRVVAVP